MKKLLILGLGVSGINAQVVDNEARVNISTTAAQITPYSASSVSVTSEGRPPIVAIPSVMAVPAGSVMPAPTIVPQMSVLDTVHAQQSAEMQQINNELAQFYALHAYRGGDISSKDWFTFANGLVARHPDMLELRCDRPSGTGRTYIRFPNPFYLSFSGVSSWCRVYVRAHVIAPLNPTYATPAGTYFRPAGAPISPYP